MFIRSHVTGEELPVTRCKQELAFKAGTSNVVRHQFPLDLGYSITSHKIQGFTLPKVYVQMDDSFFSSGQAYVAISRTKSLDSLFITKYDRNAIKLSDRNKMLMDKLETADLLNPNRENIDIRLPHPTSDTPVTAISTPVTSTDATHSKPDENHSVNPKAQSTTTNCSLPSHVQNKERKRKIAVQSDYVPPRRQAILQQNVIASDILLNKEPIVYNQQMRKDVNVRQCLHPGILQYYEPVATSPDGNCLWNMISICLFGNETAMSTLRQLTANTIQNQHAHFAALVAHNQDNASVEQLIRDAKTRGSWGGEYHLYALSLALNRRIFIYSTCKSAETGLFYSPQGTAEDIARFNGFSQWRGHLVYKPRNITAVLPKSENTMLFIPYSNITLLPDT